MGIMDRIIPNPQADALVGRNDLEAVYLDVCGPSLEGDAKTASLAASTLNDFRESIGGFADRISYIFARDRRRWLEGRFLSYLDDGRNCPESTPGYQKNIPGGSADPGFTEFVRDVIMPSHILAFERGKGFVIDRSILGMDFDDAGGIAKLFSPPSAEAPISEMDEPDLMILWSAAPPDESYGEVERVQMLGAMELLPEFYGEVDDRRFLAIESNYLSRGGGSYRFMGGIVVTPGKGRAYPVDAVSFAVWREKKLFTIFIEENGEQLAAYIEGLRGKPLPTRENPLPLEDILGAMGYSFSHNAIRKIGGDYYARFPAGEIMLKFELEMIKAYERFAKNRRDEDDQWYLIHDAAREPAAEHMLIAAIAAISIGDARSAAKLLQSLETPERPYAHVINRIYRAWMSVLGTDRGGRGADGGGGASGGDKSFGGVKEEPPKGGGADAVGSDRAVDHGVSADPAQAAMPPIAPVPNPKAR